jgi:hypothetical protein
MSNANDLDFFDFFPADGETPSLPVALDLPADEDGELAHFFDDLDALEAESQGQAPAPATSPLTPPLWQEYQALQAQVACLTQALAENERCKTLRKRPNGNACNWRPSPNS